MSEISNKCYGNKTIAMLTPLEEKMLAALVEVEQMVHARERNSGTMELVHKVITEAIELKYTHH